MSRTVKWLWIALAVSLSLNVFFLGFYAARAARRSHDSHGEAWIEHGALRDKWKEQTELLRGRREAVDNARRAVRTALVDQPFDARAFEAALTGLRGETSETQAALDQALVRFVEGMGPEDRRRLADSRWFANLGRNGKHER